MRDSMQMIPSCKTNVNSKSSDNVDIMKTPPGSPSNSFCTVKITKENISEKQEKLIEAITKRTVLVSFCVFSSIIVVILLGIRTMYGGIVKITLETNYFRIWTIINCQINIVCLLCQFKFFQHDKYQKYCKHLHGTWKNLVSHFVVKDMKRQYEASVQ